MRSPMATRSCSVTTARSSSAPPFITTSTVRPTRDLTAVISQIVDVPSILVVHPSLPVKTVRQLIDFAKERPGKLNFASPGQRERQPPRDGSVSQEARELDMTHIPYKGGAGPAVTALVSGETQLMFTTLASAVGFVKAGRLRALAVTSPARLAVLPEVPTTTELGITELVGGSWQGLFFPKDTPAAIVERAFAATAKAMADDEVKRRLATDGVEVVVSSSSADFAKFVATETSEVGQSG